MSAPKNLFPGGSYVTSLPDMAVHQVISGPQRYNTEKSCWEYDPTYNSKVTFENSSGVTLIGPPKNQITSQTIGASTMWNPGFGQFDDSPPQNSPHRRQDDQEQFYELNEGWKKDSDLIKNLRNRVTDLGRIVDLKNEEIAELKKQLEAERRKYLVEIKPFEKNPWDQIEELKREREQFLQECLSRADTEKTLSREIGRLTTQLEKERKQRVELARHNVDLVEELQTKYAQINQLQTQCAALQTCVKPTPDQEQPLQPSVIDSINRAIVELREELIDRMRDSQNILVRELLAKGKDIEHLEDRLDSVNFRISELHTDFQKQINELEQSHEEKIDSINSRLHYLCDDED